MRVLSLFSGGGLGDYGLTLAGMEIVGQVEIDEYCQKILKLRWPDVPKWTDIKNVRGEEVIERCGAIDLISGGFPCQDISTAGKGEGITGKRSGLWKEMFRIICEIRPKYCLVENVTALLDRGLDVVLGDLAAVRYDCEWDCIPASAFCAPHQRDRVFIVAHSNGGLLQRVQTRHKQVVPKRVFGTSPKPNHPFSYEPRLFRFGNYRGLRECDGTPKRMDRLKLLGNGQVVQVVEWIGKQIMAFNKKESK